MSDAPLRRWKDRFTEHYEVWWTLGGKPFWLLTTTMTRPAAEQAAAAWHDRPATAQDAAPSWLSTKDTELLEEFVEVLIAQEGPEAAASGTRIRRRRGPAPSVKTTLEMLGTLLGGVLVGVLVVYLPIPPAMWRRGGRVLALTVTLVALVGIWLPARSLGAVEPCWDGTEDDDG